MNIVDVILHDDSCADLICEDGKAVMLDQKVEVLTSWFDHKFIKLNNMLLNIDNVVDALAELDLVCGL